MKTIVKERIEYIDLAKGFCIVLVVFTHIIGYYCLNPECLFPLGICRIPLYFLLSGLFFKQYNGLADFCVRKINKLLIPFIFFYITTSIILPWILKHIGYGVRNEDIVGIKALGAFINTELFPNMPIWFLLCLFEINIIFYLISCIKIRNRNLFICIICFLLGIGGIYLGNYHINLPMFIDSALSALPFFCIGYMLNRHTDFLRPNKYDKYIIPFMILCAIYSILFSVDVVYSHNEYYGTNPWWVYTCGLSGVLFFIFLAKKLRKLPLFSYWGRYSIIILVTHNPVIQFLLNFGIKRLELSIWTSIFITLAVTMALYSLIIPFMIKYFPYVTAQKDVIKVK